MLVTTGGLFYSETEIIAKYVQLYTSFNYLSYINTYKVYIIFFTLFFLIQEKFYLYQIKLQHVIHDSDFFL